MKLHINLLGKDMFHCDSDAEVISCKVVRVVVC